MGKEEKAVGGVLSRDVLSVPFFPGRCLVAVCSASLLIVFLSLASIIFWKYELSRSFLFLSSNQSFVFS